MDNHLFLTGLIYLTAAAIAAPLGRRLGLGSVLGYLIVGAIIGPAAFGLVGEDSEEVMHFAEFGVVLMLFVIGLEIDLSRLWRMRGSILGVGGLQVLATTAVLALAALILLKLDWREALALGMILSLSSTAIVMQNLRDRNLSDTASGTQSFAVLLFQDIAVIPIIALLPLLSFLPLAANDAHAQQTLIDSLPGWSKGLVVVGAIALVVIIGRFLLTPWLRWVASLKVTEALTATTVALVVGIAYLMNQVGLSPALGTFVAGVMLASSEFRHELESDIEPFKALLLAVFFIAVGAGIDFGLIADQPLTIGLMVAVLISLKFAVLYGLAKWFKMAFDQRLLFAAALAQGGEFAFVLGGFAVGQGVIKPETAGQVIAAVALSMALAPPLLLLVQRVLLPRLGTTEADQKDTRDHDVENDHARVLLAGFGRFGHPMGRLLRSAGCMPTVLERDSDHVDFLRRIGLKCYYGDAIRPKLLKAAGAEQAEVLILAIDSEDECMQIIETCKKHYPHLKIFARACSRHHAYLLHEAGVKFFIEQLGSSLDCAIAALQAIGHDPGHAKDAARRFKEHEMQAIADAAPVHEDEEKFMGMAQQNLKDLDSLLVNAPLPVGRGKSSS